MTALFNARQRVEEFAAAVDAPHRQVSEELQPLVEVVGSLRSHADADLAALPRADFAAELRARLMSEAAEVLTPGSPLVLPARPRGRRERHLVAAASAVVLLGGSAGMAAAAQDALPGDALYPVKRGIERAEAGLSMSSSGKGRDLLHQADGRLTEVQDLLADDSVARSSRVSLALEDFSTQAEQGAGLLMEAYRTDRDPSSIVAVREFSAQGITTLQEIARTAPPETQEELTAAALTLREIDVRASGMCTTCAAELPTLEVPGIFLVAAEADRALTAVDARRLDNSHPFLVPKGLLTKTGQDLTEQLTDSDGSTGGLTGGSSGGSGGGSSDADDPTGVTGDTEVSEPGQKKLAETTEELTDTVEDTVDDTVGDITDGLSGAVETLLPDPSGGSLLP